MHGEVHTLHCNARWWREYHTTHSYHISCSSGELRTATTPQTPVARRSGRKRTLLHMQSTPPPRTDSIEMTTPHSGHSRHGETATPPHRPRRNIENVTQPSRSHMHSAERYSPRKRRCLGTPVRLAIQSLQPAGDSPLVAVSSTIITYC